MKSPVALATFLLAASVAADCPDEKRIDGLKYIVNAFNTVPFLKSAELIDGMPLAPDCDAYLFINGLPGISPAFDSTTVKDFSQVVRQAFVNVEAKYSAHDNNTATLDAIVTLGVLHVVESPVYTHIVVPAIFNDDCLITELPTYITLPSDLAGNPITPPMFPAIPGLAELPGLKPILKALIPYIGDVFHLL